MSTTKPGGALSQAEERAGNLGIGVYAFLLCLVTLAVVGVLGLVAKKPFLFPSLGPTVMLFFESPKKPSASARNAVIGHMVAIAVGVACLYGFGLGHDLPATQTGLTAVRILAAGLSVAATALVLQLLRSNHPPAGATTLIVSLGVLKTASQLASMVIAVLLVTVAAVGLNRLLGVDHPLVPQAEPG
jgi:CBS-domain-containing membrane protein